VSASARDAPGQPKIYGTPRSAVDLVVGRIGRAHGIRGEVAVEVRTDDPDARLAVGSRLGTDPADRGPLTVTEARPRSGGLIVAFAGICDRAAAEALRGTLLLVDAATLPALDDPDEFYDHELVGLAVQLPDGTPVGAVHKVVHGPGGDLLVVRANEDPQAGEHLVPFVRAIVPTVDVAGGRVVIDPPPGLLEL
jgi:16S rRNA processing protein RimM